MKGDEGCAADLHTQYHGRETGNAVREHITYNFFLISTQRAQAQTYTLLPLGLIAHCLCLLGVRIFAIKCILLKGIITLVL